VSIHTEHPFLTPEPDRDPVRRARGRLNAPVTVWAAGAGRTRTGLTVSSIMIAEGSPAEVIGLLNADSGLAESLHPTGTVAISLLGGRDRLVADVFAGSSPSPGGKFRTGSWSDTDWGPVLDGVPAWIGARLVDEQPVHAGWSWLVRARIETVRLADLTAGDQALGYLRGRYRFLSWAG
jgi:flavin reductase (DIM6/NTAB) family NADH-FMN oxidoreductase RutF